MPALIIAANLPDVDAACFFWLEGTEHLGFRRGITHGPPAMLLLPLILAALLWWYDRWQAARGKRPEGRLPVSFKWLCLLSLIGCLSHPLFDWFNNYGVRALEPFSSTWFYGDVLFIIDVWILAILGLGIWRSMRREREGQSRWSQPARTAWAALLVYIGINAGISDFSADRVRMDDPYPAEVMANPVPVAFWRREVLWRTETDYGAVNWSPFGARNRAGPGQRHNMADPHIAEWSKGNPQAEAFLFWSRMPVAELHNDHIVLRDQRFMESPVGSEFTVTLRPD